MLSEDLSFYVRNASVTDSTLAPEGHSSVYVLVPVPNQQSEIDWNTQKEIIQNRVLKALEKHAEMIDIKYHIREEIIVHTSNMARYEYSIRSHIQPRAFIYANALF